MRSFNRSNLQLHVNRFLQRFSDPMESVQEIHTQYELIPLVVLPSTCLSFTLYCVNCLPRTDARLATSGNNLAGYPPEPVGGTMYSPRLLCVRTHIITRGRPNFMDNRTITTKAPEIITIAMVDNSPVPLSTVNSFGRGEVCISFAGVIGEIVVMVTFGVEVGDVVHASWKLPSTVGQVFGVETLLMELREVVALVGSAGFGSVRQRFSNELSVAIPLCWGCIIEILCLSELPQHSSGPTVKSDLSLLELNSRAVTGRVFLSVKYPSSTCHILALLSQLQNLAVLTQVGGSGIPHAHFSLLGSAPPQ